MIEKKKKHAETNNETKYGSKTRLDYSKTNNEVNANRFREVLQVRHLSYNH